MTRFPLFLLTLLAAGLAAAASAQGGAQNGGLGERTGPRGKPAQIGNPTVPDSGGIVTHREGQVSGQSVGAPGDGQGIRHSQPDAGHDRFDVATWFGDTPGLNGGDLMQGVKPARQGGGQNQIYGDVFEGTGIRSREPARSVRNQPGVNGGNRVQDVQPGQNAGQTQIMGDVYEGTGIRGRQPRRSAQGQVRRRPRGR